MSTTEEQQAAAEAEAAVANDPAARARYEELLRSDQFRRPDGGYPGDPPGANAQTRISILRQIAHYPEARVIENLDQLSRRSWFNDMSTDDKQRMIRIVAYGSSETTAGAAGNTTRRNTIDSIVRNDDPPIKFADLKNDNTGRTWGQHSTEFLLWGGDITLNRSLIAANDDPIADGSDEAHLAVNTLAHELNHHLNPGSNEASHDYFMDEYRAWYVGYVSQHGHPPSQREAWDRSRELTMADIYPNLRDVLDGKDHWFDGNDASDEQKELVRFLAQVAGLDPDTATIEDLRQRSKSDIPADAVAPPPVQTDNDANNLDNHTG